MHDTKNLLKHALHIARTASKQLAKHQETAKIDHFKGQGDFALDADLQSERYIVKELHKLYPEHNIFTEESGKHPTSSPYTWIIDPLDGTLNYAHHIPLWTICIACWHNNTPLVSVVIAPALKETFHAEQGIGAYLNGKRIYVNHDRNLEKALYSGTATHLSALPLNRHLLRALGCSSLELAYVACGRFSARIKLRECDPFGYAAGSLLVIEARGQVTNLSNKQYALETDGALASNGTLHQKLLQMIQNTQ